MTSVPLIRDYPAGTLVQARYSWVLLKRDLNNRSIDQETFTRHSTRILASIARFANEINQGGKADCGVPDAGDRGNSKPVIEQTGPTAFKVYPPGSHVITPPAAKSRIK